MVRKIPGHVEPPPINQCDNPTINGEFTDTNTPPPPPSDKQGATPPPTDTPTGPTDNGSGVVTGGAGPVTVAGSTAPSGSSGATGKGDKKGRKLVALGADKGSGDLGTDALAVSTGPVSPPAQRDPLPLLLYVVAAAVALIAIFGPPSLSSYLKRQNSS